MEFSEGVAISEALPSLSQNMKHAIAVDFCSHPDQLRSLKGDYIGSLNNKPLRNKALLVDHAGPVKSERQLNEALLESNYYRNTRLETSMLSGLLHEKHQAVFTHGKLSSSNIRVRNNKIVAITNWSSAGCAELQLVSVVRVVQSEDYLLCDYHMFLQTAVTSYHPEAAVFSIWFPNTT